MKIAQTCVCGASVEIEDDQVSEVKKAIKVWREAHHCDGTAPWRRSDLSTGHADTAFGFLPDYTKSEHLK